MDFARVMEVLAALHRQRVEYVLVGGVAVGLHGLPRATDDVDIFVRPDQENVARLRLALQSVWSDPGIEEIRAEDLGGEYPAVRYGPPEGDLTLDILARLGEAFAYDDLEVQLIVIEGVEVRLATPMTLYRMKKDTVRAIDRHDAQALRERFGLGESSKKEG